MRRDALIELRRSLGLTQGGPGGAHRRGHIHRRPLRAGGDDTPGQGPRYATAEALGVTPRRFAELLAVGASALDIGRADEAWTTVSAPGADDLDAVELIRRVAASDVRPGHARGARGCCRPAVPVLRLDTTP